MASLTKRKIKSKKFPGTVTSRIYYITWYDEFGIKKFKSTGKVQRYKAEKDLENFIKKLNGKISDDIMLSELFNEILEYGEYNVGSGTLKIWNSVCKLFLKTIPVKRFDQLRSYHIEEYKKIRLSSIKPVTVNIELRTLKRFFNLAVELNLIEYHKLKFKQLEIEKTEKPALSEPDKNTLADFVKNIPNKNMRSIILLNFNTGCRLSEILNLQIKDILLDERIIKIRNKLNFKTKFQKIRDVFMNDETYNLLKDLLYDSTDNIHVLKDPESYLFSPENNKVYDKSYVSKYFKKIVRKLQLSEIYKFHSGRHTVASKLANSNVPINIVMEILGHSDIKTTMGYVKGNQEEKRKAMEKI